MFELADCGGNDHQVLAFRAFAFLSGMNTKSTNTLAAVRALEYYLVRPGRDNAWLMTLWARDPFACVLLINVKLLTTILAGKLNHSLFILISVATRTGVSLHLV
jgi:hypothetical protein